MIYYSLLVVHSYLRWVVVAAGVVAVLRAFLGVRSKRPFTKADALAGLVLVAAFDLQIVLGLLLYTVASPFTSVAFGNPRAAMKLASLRFWMVEHPFAMVIAAALLHVGRVRVARAPDDAAKHRQARFYFGLGLLALLIGIPWPALPYARPLLRV
jgi:hypothetical protein